MNDKNVAVRIPWELWNRLDKLRASRQASSKTKITLSDITREALENYVGDTWTEKQKNEQK